jgi:hypothetical protein
MTAAKEPYDREQASKCGRNWSDRELRKMDKQFVEALKRASNEADKENKVDNSR